MFLTEDDYITVSEDALRILQQSKPGNREQAEKTAVEEMKGYLRGRYDVEKVFGATGYERNNLLIMYACDIVLYNLASGLPSKMGWELKEKRYLRAIEWLEDVQKGKITPGLPTYTGENGEKDINNPIRCGYGEKNIYTW